MSSQKKTAHPYIPNTAPETRKAMLRTLGLTDIDELYREIPPELRYQGRLKIPEALGSEWELKRHVESIMAQNSTWDDYTGFVGAGCWRHFVPAVCDEIGARGEFLTAYAGDTYADHGKHQAWFEFQCLIAELVEMDVVSFPTYDWGSAAGSALSMAVRLTGRHEVVVPRNLSPEKTSFLEGFLRQSIQVTHASFDPASGRIDLEDLQNKISENTAAVYIENPGFLGPIEDQGDLIADLIHRAGGLLVVGVDPISLGLLAPPSAYGADLVCGEAQPLGIRMNCGGGLCGFIAGRDDRRYLAEFPTLLETIGPTAAPNEIAFGWAYMERTSFNKRDLAEDFTGTSTGLWAIIAGVYLALMGPEGLREVGETIMSKSRYAAMRLNDIKGVRAPMFSAPGFKEFVVDFNDSGLTVAEINQKLLGRKIFGGPDLSRTFPELGQSALYCVTEVITKSEIDRLASSLKEIIE